MIYAQSGINIFLRPQQTGHKHIKDKLEEIMSTRQPGYTCSLTGDALYEEICWQKRIDTWGEGCRYFDAKRRNETIDRAKSVNYDPDRSRQR